MASRCFQFQINPILSSELDVGGSELFIRYRVKKNGKSYGPTDQISCSNYGGVTFFEKVRLLIG